MSGFNGISCSAGTKKLEDEMKALTGDTDRVDGNSGISVDFTKNGYSGDQFFCKTRAGHSYQFREGGAPTVKLSQTSISQRLDLPTPQPAQKPAAPPVLTPPPTAHTDPTRSESQSQSESLSQSETASQSRSSSEESRSSSESSSEESESEEPESEQSDSDQSDSSSDSNRRVAKELRVAEQEIRIAKRQAKQERKKMAKPKAQSISEGEPKQLLAYRPSKQQQQRKQSRKPKSKSNIAEPVLAGLKTGAANSPKTPPANTGQPPHSERPNGLPCYERANEIVKEAAEAFIKNISDSTSAMYGDMKDPLSKRGYAGEFAKWCVTGPNVVYNGVVTSPNKQVYLAPHASDLVVFEYMQSHFLKRKQWDRRKKEYCVDLPFSKSAYQNCLKSLKKLYEYQSLIFPGGPQEYTNRYGKPPNHNRAISALFDQYSRTAVKTRKALHRPRGLGALVMEGYTQEQNIQLCEWGLSNASLRKHVFHRLTPDRVRSAHLHHTWATSFTLRFDDRVPLQWSQFCCQDPPDRMRGHTGPLLTCVLEKRKTNQTGQVDTVMGLRHLFCPYQCPWFAFSYELYCQIWQDNMKFFPEDFLPRPRLDSSGQHTGTFIHPWFDRYIFYGFTKSEKGRASQADPLKKISYDSCLRLFKKKVYKQIDPPIDTYHKLHLQRGASVRKAEQEGVEHHQIGRHGGWVQHGDSLSTHYLTGAPMEMIRLLAGYEPKLQPGTEVPVMLRSLVTPPQELIDMVFPFVKQVTDQMAQRPQDYPERRTLDGFLGACRYAAIVLLQDAAYLQTEDGMSDNAIYSTPLFNSQLYISFREELHATVSLYKDNHSQQLSKQAADSANCLHLLKKLYMLCEDWGGYILNCKVEDPELDALIQDARNSCMGRRILTFANPTASNPTSPASNPTSPASPSAAFSPPPAAILPPVTTPNAVRNNAISPSTMGQSTPDSLDKPPATPDSPQTPSTPTLNHRQRILERVMNRQDADEPATQQQTQVETINYMGHHIPLDIANKFSFARERKSFASQACDMTKPECWPTECPKWAQLKWLLPQPSSTTVAVEEYLVGVPSGTAALRDLEKKYGPDTPGIKKGCSWRSHSTLTEKERNRRRKQWCERQAFYRFLEKAWGELGHDVALVQERVNIYITSNFQSELENQARDNQAEDPGFPGYSIMLKTWKKMRSEEPEAASHAAKGRHRAAVRRDRKEKKKQLKTASDEAEATWLQADTDRTWLQRHQ